MIKPDHFINDVHLLSVETDGDVTITKYGDNIFTTSDKQAVLVTTVVAQGKKVVSSNTVYISGAAVHKAATPDGKVSYVLRFIEE